ncbi:MAG: hypothetical protein ACQER1_16020 [Armatimonadota bacterium]
MNRRMMIAITLAATISSAAVSAQLTAGDLTADYTEQPGATLSIGEADMQLEFEIIDGRTGEALDAQAGDLGDDLIVSQQPAPDGSMLRWPVIFANAGDEQCWLEVRAVITPGSDGPFGFWNGHADYSPAPDDIPSMPAEMCTPLVSLSGQSAGIAWGLEADALMSWYEGGAEDGRFHFGCRIVVDPGETYELPLVIFGHPATFGYLDAFERYHDLFPESFAIERPNVDPRATGAGCDYVGWHQGSPELVRRVGGSWDWCMKSWRLPGNWANREEHWREEFGDYDRLQEIWAEKATHIDLCDFAGMYYIWPAWTDEDLAAERWPEALIDDPLAPRTQWMNVTMAHLTFPANEAYLAWTKDHLREVLAGGEYHGFGLDSAGSDGRARGPDAQASPGRAWDDEGVYCRANAGMAQLMDTIHEMDAQDGRKAAAVPNGGDWMILSRADSILIEHSPLRWKNDWVDRLNAGEKVLNWWDQFDLFRLIEWESASREEARHDMAAMARFMRLRSLQLGGVPMYRQASGIVSTMEDLPEIVETVRAGWQPVPAMRGDERLWLSRYGDRGPWETRLVACNPEDEAISGEIEIFTEYLPHAAPFLQETADVRNWLFADVSGDPLVQRIADEKCALQTTIPPAWQRVFRPMALASDRAHFTAEVSFAGDVHERTLRIEVTDMLAPFEIAPISMIHDWYSTLDARTVTVTEPGTVELPFASTSFASPAEEILSFPFIEDGEAACSIVIPEDATEDEEYAAFRVQEYFRFWHSEPNRDGEPAVEGPMIPIVRGEAGGRSVVLSEMTADELDELGEPPARIGVEDGDLLVEYAEDEIAASVAYKLLRLLNREHPFYGATPEKFEDEREQALYERAGLIREVLDDREALGM